MEVIDTSTPKMIQISEIKKLIPNLTEARTFCQINGIYTIRILGYVLPQEGGYDMEYFLQFICSKKKVLILFNILVTEDW
jgi:hypothetical protein